MRYKEERRVKGVNQKIEKGRKMRRIGRRERRPRTASHEVKEGWQGRKLGRNGRERAKEGSVWRKEKRTKKPGGKKKDGDRTRGKKCNIRYY